MIGRFRILQSCMADMSNDVTQVRSMVIGLPRIDAMAFSTDYS
jgi:hypothetical protein